MKSLLVAVNAKYIHSNLALYSLRAYAKKYVGIECDIQEYTINMPLNDIVRGIYNASPDLVAFSVYIWNVDIIMNVIHDIRTIMPDVKIYLGGPEVSFESSNILIKNQDIDGIMMGEGEETFARLLEYYENGHGSKSDILGLCYRDGNRVVENEKREPIDLSSVPFPYNDLSDFENRIIYYESSRGCPFGCAYCLSSVDKTVRFRDIELVKREFLFFLNHKVPQVKLVDRTFNIDHKRSLEMLWFIRDNDNGITNFHFEIAGDILTDAEIEMINSLRPGLVQLEIGVQSTNEETLKAINRRTDFDRLKTNVSRLLDGGKVHLHLDLIAGLPYENLESFKKSFNEVYSMHSHELQLGFLKVLKGAPINGQVLNQEIKHSTYSPYEVLSTKYISYDEICELKQVEEMLEIYHNSCQFMESEKYLLGFEDTPYDMYLGLAKFYKEKNQPVIQCKRAVRYELLLEYANRKFGGISDISIEKLRYLLTIDYYARENAKARPEFAINIDEYKTDIRVAYERVHTENPDISKNLIHVEPNIDGRLLWFNYNKKSCITGNAEMKNVDMTYKILLKA